MTDDPRRPSLIDLFREEARTQARVLNDGLLALDRSPRDATAPRLADVKNLPDYGEI